MVYLIKVISYFIHAKIIWPLILVLNLLTITSDLFSAGHPLAWVKLHFVVISHRKLLRSVLAWKFSQSFFFSHNRFDIEYHVNTKKITQLSLMIYIDKPFVWVRVVVYLLWLTMLWLSEKKGNGSHWHYFHRNSNKSFCIFYNDTPLHRLPLHHS